MGWWRPYFFIDPYGSQLLFSWAEIDGPQSLLLSSMAVAVLALFDRWVADRSDQMRKRLRAIDIGDSCRDLWLDQIRAVSWWTLQKLSGGMLMLILMSFCAVLFLETVVFLGLAGLEYFAADQKLHSHVVELDNIQIVMQSF